MTSVTETSIDYTPSLGCFLMLARDGKLDAIERIALPSEGDAYELTPAGVNLSILSPLIARVQRSNLLFAIPPGDSARTSLMMKVRVGGSKRILPAMGNVTEILTRALDNHSLPIVAEVDVAEALRDRGDAGAALHVPLRSLEIREHLPKELVSALRALALGNISARGGKGERLRPCLVAIRSALRDTVLCDYMMKCLWLDHQSGQLGNVTGDGSGVEFVPFDADDEEISAFLCALEKDNFGEFVLDFREFANVLPTPRRNNPWLGPTMHIYKPDFRAEHGLEEHYSLYAGFRELSTIGAPVLIYHGQNPLLEPTAVRFLKVSDRSINLLQGRILEGNLLQEGVREFTAQALVWKA